MDFIVKWVLFQPVHKLPSALRWEKGVCGGGGGIQRRKRKAKKNPFHPSGVVIK